MNVLEHLENILGEDLVREVPTIVNSVKDQMEMDEDKAVFAAVGNNEGRDIRVLSVDVMYDKDRNYLIGNVWVLANLQTEYVIMQVQMLQKDSIIAQNTFADIRPDTVDLHVIGKPTGSFTAEDIKIQVSIFDKVCNNSLKNMVCTYSIDEVLGMNNVVKKIEVIDPRNKVTDVGHTINVSFNRKSQLMNKVDYDYTPYRISSGQQPVYLVGICETLNPL